MRLSRQELYIKITELIALRGSCLKLQVGCILIDKITNRIVSMGYNSSFSGTPHCKDIGCLEIDNHCIRCLHAEQAAIMNLEHKYDSLICYVTHCPCINCFKLLAASNIKTIYYGKFYESKERDWLNREIKMNLEYYGS